MRHILAIFILALAACNPSNHQPSANEGAAGSKVPQRLVTSQSATSEAPQQDNSRQRIRAFGGTIVGSNMGEWGGEVKFLLPDGTSYSVISDNSAGVFAMPYGIVALTGLAHMGSNRGAVYTISKSADSRISAALLMKLPGAPCDAAKSGDDINMRIGYWEERGPNDSVRKYACYRLTSDKNLVRYECSVPEPTTCDPG